jgi:anti-sigma B factor antagonist
VRRPDPTGLRIEQAGDEDTPMLVLAGELDAESVAALEESVGRCCAQGGNTITLDLRKLTFIDSSGLWAITRARKRCEQHGCGFSLIPGPKSVQGVFEVTGLIDVLPFRAADTADA